MLTFGDKPGTSLLKFTVTEPLAGQPPEVISQMLYSSVVVTGIPKTKTVTLSVRSPELIV